MNSRFFSQAEVFVAIARRGSITDAADDLRISKSNASQKLTEMEDALDLKLFNRTTRNVELTPAGKKLFDQFARAVDEVSKVYSEVWPNQQRGEGVSGPVTIAGSNIYLTEYVLPTLGPFLNQFPNVKINVVGSDRPVDAREDNIDLRIRVGAIDPKGVRLFPLKPIARLLCVGAHSNVNAASITHPKELTGLPTILREQENPVWSFQKSSQNWNFEASAQILVNSYELAVQSVRQGLGMGILAKDIVEQDISDGRIIKLLPEWKITDLPVSLVASYTRLRKPQVLALARFIEKELG